MSRRRNDPYPFHRNTTTPINHAPRMPVVRTQPARIPLPVLPTLGILVLIATSLVAVASAAV